MNSITYVANITSTTSNLQTFSQTWQTPTVHPQKPCRKAKCWKSESPGHLPFCVTPAEAVENVLCVGRLTRARTPETNVKEFVLVLFGDLDENDDEDYDDNGNSGDGGNDDHK